MSVLLALLARRGAPITQACLAGPLLVSADAAPDGMGTWIRPSADVGLGRGALLLDDDEPRGPLTLAGHASIVFDGRLHDRLRLCAALNEHDARITPRDPDSVLFRTAYLTWGLDAFPRLRGDWAAIVWDERARRLVCARDIIGVRPLFYLETADRLIVASELRQLRAACQADWPLDRDVVQHFATHWRRPHAGTCFHLGPRPLPPGTMLVADSSSLRVTQHSAFVQEEPLIYRTRDDYAAALRVELTRAIAARQCNARPTGLLLSGGLDSSTIASLAPRPLSTFTFTFPEAIACDESTWVMQTTRRLGTTPTFVPAHAADAFHGMPTADEPDATFAAEPHWASALRTFAAQKGRVMLRGDGGETVLLGESDAQFMDWLRLGRFVTLAREFVGHARTYERHPHLPWRRFMRRPDEPFRDRARQIAYEQTVAPRAPGGFWGVAAHAANRFGVTFAFPWLDVDLLRFLFRVPLWVFWENGLDRAIARRATSSRLPDSVRMRRDPTAFNPWLAHLAQFPHVRSLAAHAPLGITVAPDAPAHRILATAQLAAWYHGVPR